MCPISPWPPGWLLPGGEEVWGERDRPGDTYSELLCVISHVSTPPKPNAERMAREGSRFRRTSLHPAQPKSQQLFRHP